MSHNGQQDLFYEDPYDAFEKSIATSGKTKKDIASIIYPGKKLETASSLLTRAMSPENTDVNLNIEMILTIMRETRADDFLFYLCDEFGFERPSKKDKKTFQKEIKEKVSDLSSQVQALMKQVKTLENVKD